MATTNYSAQHSLDTEAPPQDVSKNMPAPARRSPRPWGLTSARLWLHILIIIFAIPCIVLSLVPVADMQDPLVGEGYWMDIQRTAGLSLAPFLCLFLSVAEIATHHIRPEKSGIHPFWFLGLCIFVMLGAWVAAIMNGVLVGLKFEDKKSIFLNYNGDTCEDRTLWNSGVHCTDGFYEREAMFVALTVLLFALAVTESALCCFLSCSDVKVRKQERRAQLAA